MGKATGGLVQHGFGKSGVESYHLEDFSTFRRKKPFRFYFFVNLKKRKWFLLGSGLVGISVFLIPAFAKPFPVVRHAAKIAHKVCENRKIYLKFLNKPNFNVPKNWGKIFGKTA